MLCKKDASKKEEMFPRVPFHFSKRFAFSKEDSKSEESTFAIENTAVK